VAKYTRLGLSLRMMPQHQLHAYGVMWGRCGSSKLRVWCLQVWWSVSAWRILACELRHGPFACEPGIMFMMNLQFIPATRGAGTACDTAWRHPDGVLCCSLSMLLVIGAGPLWLLVACSFAWLLVACPFARQAFFLGMLYRITVVFWVGPYWKASVDATCWVMLTTAVMARFWCTGLTWCEVQLSSAVWKHTYASLGLWSLTECAILFEQTSILLRLVALYVATTSPSPAQQLPIEQILSVFMMLFVRLL